MKKILILLNIFMITFLIANDSCQKQIEIYDYNGILKEDIITIDKYLEDNHITAEKSPSGLRYVIHDSGFGDFPTVGKTISMNYRGMLLDSTEFDNSFDDAVAYSFTLGGGGVIAGVDEGVQYIAERGKITLYIPSPLAYKSIAAGDIIKPNSILVFYIELLNVL